MTIFRLFTVLPEFDPMLLCKKIEKTLILK